MSNVDWYILGHNRAYSPTLMRFHSPDAASPFRHGGLNAYVYCSGNPVNRSDPSGEGWLDWMFVGMGALAAGVGIVLSAGTLGPALVAAVTLSANLSQATAVGLLAVDLTSVALDIASAKATEDGNDALAMKLALSSMVLGAASLKRIGAKTVGSRETRAFTRGQRYVSTPRVNSEWTTIHMPMVTGPGHPPGLRSAPSMPPPPVDAPVTGSVVRHGTTTGIQRVNTAAAHPAFRQMLIDRGLASEALLDWFPRGIDIRDRASVIETRGILSLGVLGQQGLNREMLTQTGFTRRELESLDPSRVPGGVDDLDEFDASLADLATTERTPMRGERLYRTFLDTGNLIWMQVYAKSLARARRTNQWTNWDS